MIRNWIEQEAKNFPELPPLDEWIDHFLERFYYRIKNDGRSIISDLLISYHHIESDW